MTTNGKTPHEPTGQTAKMDLAAIVAAVPEIRDAVGRLHVGPYCKRVFGRPTTVVDSKRDSDVSRWIQIGALVLRLEELEAKLGEIQTKAEIACAGEKNWHYAFAARDKLIFANNVGDYAEMPVDVAHAIFAKIPADCRLERDKTRITFLRGERRVASIPRVLFSVLNKVLASVPWNTLLAGQVQAPQKAKE